MIDWTIAVIVIITIANITISAIAPNSCLSILRMWLRYMKLPLSIFTESQLNCNISVDCYSLVKFCFVWLMNLSIVLTKVLLSPFVTPSMTCLLYSYINLTWSKRECMSFKRSKMTMKGLWRTQVIDCFTKWLIKQFIGLLVK